MCRKLERCQEMDVHCTRDEICIPHIILWCMCIIAIFTIFPAYSVCCVCVCVFGWRCGKCEQSKFHLRWNKSIIRAIYHVAKMCSIFWFIFRFSSYFRSGRVEWMVLLSSVLYQRMCASEIESMFIFSHVGDILLGKSGTQCVYA